MSDIRAGARCILVATVIAASLSSASDAQNPAPFNKFSPAACALAPSLMQTAAFRERRDTAVYQPSKAPPARFVRDSIRMCADRFAGKAIDGSELLNVARVQLTLGEDSIARAALERYLKSLETSPAERRAWALYLSVLDHLEAQPPRLTAAESLSQRIEKLGREAGRLTVSARVEMMRAWYKELSDEDVLRQARLIIKDWQSLRATEAVEASGAVGNAYMRMAEIAQRRGDIVGARAISDSGLQLLKPAGGEGMFLMQLQQGLIAMLGKPAPAIVATYWFSSERTPIPDSLPRRGHVTIVSQSSHSGCPYCEWHYRIFRRYAARFGPDLDFVTATRTLGFFGDSAPLNPAREAQHDSALVFGKKGQPGYLGVVETRHDTIPDGRRINFPTPNEARYPAANFVITDKKGIVRYVTFNLDDMSETAVAAVIERLIAEP